QTSSEESGADETVDIRPSHEEAAEEAMSDVVETDLARAEIDAAEDEAAREATQAVIAGEMAKAEIDAAEEEISEQTVDAVEEAATEEAIVETVAAEAEEAPAPEAAPTQDGAAEDEDATPAVLRGPGEWYVVHTYAGYENKVRANLGSRIQSMQMEEKIFDVVIPMEDVMEIKGGKKQVVQKKVFPGYLLVRMVYDNDSWYVVRNTPGVTGFVSSGT